MLNLCDRTTEKKIMDDMENNDPQLVEEIRRLMFVFEDIIHVDGKGIQSVLREIDNSELALALKTASDELKEIVFSNMSTRAADLIVEDMEYMGPVRLSDVESYAAADRGRRPSARGCGRTDHHQQGGESELVV